MKKLIVALFALTASVLFGAVETVVDWNNYSVFLKEDAPIGLRYGKRTLGLIRDAKNKNLGKAEIQNGFLTIDSSGYKDSDSYPMMVFWGTKHPDETVQNKIVQVEFDISGSENGMTCEYYFEGKYTNKKHYWSKHIVTVTKKQQHIVLQQKMPDNFSYAFLRFDFRTPGIYKIGNIKYGTAEQKKVDGSVNHIPNGGAERGFYCVMPPSPKRFDGIMKVTCDTEFVHSGKHSFKLDPQNGVYNRIVFNSVPYVAGQPASFSAWMRSEKPVRAELMMYTASSHAYAKGFNIGKEWKKYTLTIPKFGERKIPGVLMAGRPDIMPAQHINPVITLLSGTKSPVWIDDLSFQLNMETTEQTPPPVYISGRLNEPCGYYRQGEPITAFMCFEPSGSSKTAELEYELVDWRGEPLIPVRKEKISLPMKKDFTFKVPEFALGPMNLKFRVISGKEVIPLV